MKIEGYWGVFKLYPSGTEWDPFDPVPELIQIEDVAHSLSMICRWGGHIAKRLSVAEHCWIGSMLIDPCFALDFLMHETEEALSGFGDIVGPVKRHPRVRDLISLHESGIRYAVAERFRLRHGYAKTPEVKAMDRWLDGLERWHLKGVEPPPDIASGIKATPPPPCWTPERARDEFLARFRYLTSGRAES